MNPAVGPPRVGDWYTRWDRGETFEVTGCDKQAHTIAVRAFNGRSEVLDEPSWDTLALSRTEPPRGWPPAADQKTSPAAPASDLHHMVWDESLLG